MLYKLYYKINNHKFQERIEAENVLSAKQKLKDKIIKNLQFDLVAPEHPEDPDELTKLKNIFGF